MTSAQGSNNLVQQNLLKQPTEMSYIYINQNEACQYVQTKKKVCLRNFWQKSSQVLK